MNERVSFTAVIVMEGTEHQHPTRAALMAWAHSKGLTVYAPIQTDGHFVLRVELADLEKPS